MMIACKHHNRKKKRKKKKEKKKKRKKKKKTENEARKVPINEVVSLREEGTDTHTLATR
jgi:hypothetical protein